MYGHFKYLTVVIILTAFFPAMAMSARIKDIASIRGIRSNQLFGYGLVIGLNGSGDKGGKGFTIQSLANLLQHMGIRVDPKDIKASNVQRRQAAERAAINAPMQGTAADIIKRAMIEVDAWLQSKKPAASLVMQVHDELVFEVRKDQLETLQKAVVKRMEGAAQLDVPLVVDSGHGPNWDTAH